jgi:hypothetical protein
VFYSSFIYTFLIRELALRDYAERPGSFLQLFAEQIIRRSDAMPPKRKPIQRDDSVPNTNTSRARVSSRSRNGNTTGARVATERMTVDNGTRHCSRQAAGNKIHPRREFSMNTRRVITDVMSRVITKNFMLPLSLFFLLFNQAMLRA